MRVDASWRRLCMELIQSEEVNVGMSKRSRTCIGRRETAKFKTAWKYASSRVAVCE